METAPGTATLRLTKFDVAERQLLQSIRMFFAEEDEVSIHTLSEAAAQVLHDIGKKENVTSILRDSSRIRPERKAEWLAIVFSSRNFFKHADRDKDQIHDFKSTFNDFSLLDAVNMYATLKKRWTPETFMFMLWFGLAHPQLVQENSDFPEILERIQINYKSARPDNKKFFAEIIDALREDGTSAPNFSLSYGAPEKDA
ncbi:hypothetical protein RS694_11010 [Rhodoferax saidenbachensis]|uniref:Uncharacterized protein n=2 Tax=Rhodoferax saidenbachensis TaxID=1484693 RepID=A0A1P8KAH5_9BURK|nr:hypothetical protein RS694_11010 [Rhodoferax saidenbachensis]